jgi:hypothetical protein
MRQRLVNPQQMIKVIKAKVKDSIILVFCPIRLSNLVNYG